MDKYKGVITTKVLQLLLPLLSVLCMGSHASVSGSRPGDVVEVRCIEREREALLEFKQGLIDEGGLLSSWGDVDHQKECCEWHGVVCSETTRHVIGLNLPFGELHGNVSQALLELQHLNHLDLSYNDFDGKEIPGFIASFPELQHLYLAYCGFSGIIPHQLGNMTNLRTLDLSWNRLEGRIPTSLANLSSLHYLNLSHNQITGLMPELRLIALRELHLSHNFLQGVVSEAHFSNLHSLKLLHLSYNSLVFNFSTTTNNWVPPFQLDVMDVASCYMGHHFPEWVQTQSNISHLGLAGVGISGQVPEWLWDLSPRLQYLNISHNQISGRVPDLSSKFSHFPIIDISFNNFSGLLPLFHPTSAILQLSRNMLRGSISSICSINYTNLTNLDLSYNQFSGPLPECWTSMSRLSILNLANNHLSGEIPEDLGQSNCLFLSLQLQSNHLLGELPSSLRNCQHLTMLDVGGNQLTGNIPAWIGTNLGMLKLLSLRDNEFFGTIPPEICHLTQIQILDLSRNNISGRIPQCFNNFTFLVQQDISTPNMIPQTEFIVMRCENAFVYWKGQDKEYNKTLRLLKLIDLSSNRLVGNIPKQLSLLRGLVSLNLSRNHLTGNIDSEIGQMNVLESLDLSRNQLSGEIPVGLAELSFLAFLDLSFNNLSGNIPSGTQLQGFNASVYAGNNGLCGPPLAACLPPDGPSSANDSKFDAGFYISTLLGFVLGFWGFIVSLVLNNSWRKAYFDLWNKIWNWTTSIINARSLR